MKLLNIIVIGFIAIALVSCSKQGWFPTPLGPIENVSSTVKSGLEDSFFKISAGLSTGSGTNGEITEADGKISVPVDKQLTLSIDEFFSKVKDVKWKINGNVISSGNKSTIQLDKQNIDIGVKKMYVEFTEVESGKKHNKELKLYIFKQKYISVLISPKSNICGEVAIGVTQTLNSYNNEKIGPAYIKESIQNICSNSQNKTAGIAKIAMNLYDPNTSFTIDLIEPLVSSSNNKLGFCFLFFCFGTSINNTTITPKQVYQSDSFSASATNNVSFGSFTSGNTVLTIE